MIIIGADKSLAQPTSRCIFCLTVREFRSKLLLLYIQILLIFLQLWLYRCADKSLARPTSRYIYFDGENISFDASLVIYINSTNIPPIMIIQVCW
jgi:hypothetical protein